MYSIFFKNQAKKFIKNLDIKNKNIILEVISKLKGDPFFYPYKKLEDFDNLFRIRKGNFRISYTVNSNQLIIEIIKVGNRKNFYKK